MKAVWNARDSDSDDEEKTTGNTANFPQRAGRHRNRPQMQNNDSNTRSSSNNTRSQHRSASRSKSRNFRGGVQRHLQNPKSYQNLPSIRNVTLHNQYSNSYPNGLLPNPTSESVKSHNSIGVHSRPFAQHHIQNPEFQERQLAQNKRGRGNGRKPMDAKFSKLHEDKNVENINRAPLKIRKMGYKSLKELICKEPSEILLTITVPENGFLILLSEVDDRREITVMMLIALGNTCRSEHKQILNHLINDVAKNKVFILCSVLRYLAGFQNSRIEKIHLQSFESLLEFLSYYNQVMPSSACETLSIIIPLLNTTCKNMQLSYPDFFASAIKAITELEFLRDNFLKEHSDEKIEVLSKMEKLHMTQPPENFRSIPILPNNVDIWNHEPFLRPNITNGKYIDIEHYLDVQFRLLREDYVRPLREGIAVYLRLKDDGKSLKKCRDVRIYTDVHIIKQEFTKGNLVHLVSFDKKQFSNINWEFSKRFLSGSLVCLSHDDFQTSYFASVAFRDAKKLQDGVLILKFELLSDDVLSFTSAISFVMIETDAYFEAYRHNLSALQEIQNDQLPLCRYIVDVQKTINSPPYLRSSTTYDMAPLFQTFESSKDALKAKVSPAISIQPLTENWPTAKELNLDESQYNALKAAITKEFVIIQGPPGTGKTYVGLKIIQLLLHNISCWRLSEKGCPVLIVCYTNHALDQFLEGVLLFTEDVVRVGGRCSNEALSCYQLDNKRKTLQDKREVPQYIFSSIKRKHFDIVNLGKELNILQQKLLLSEKKVLTEQELGFFMLDKHNDSLVHGNHQFNFKSIIHVWLDLAVGNSLPDPSMFYPEIAQWGEGAPYGEATYAMAGENNHLVPTIGHNIGNAPAVAANDATLDMEMNYNKYDDVADVEYIEDMRGISGEEFADICMESACEPEFEVDDDFLMLQEEGWHIQGGAKKLKKFITKRIKDTIPMNENDVQKVTNVWKLNYNERWQLYKYWLELFLKNGQEEILTLQQKIRTEYDEMNEMKMEENMNILRDAKVVGMTTTGAAKYRKMVQFLNPKIIIVEEAAEILESHVVTSLAVDTQHVIVIGDHQQLRPSPNVYDLAVKFNFDVSLFERMVKNGMHYQQLSIQHRMRPSIASLLVPHIYKNLENHESVSKYESIKGVSKNLFFVTHEFAENQEFDSKSRVNEHEARFMAALCRYFILQGYSSSQITVLTTYSGQLFLLKRFITNTQLLKDVRITVVDNFQGEENDIILISFVRSNEEGNIGFLKTANRVCVALSRAKKGLFAIGNFTLLAEKSELWKNILTTLKQQEAIGTTLSLICQNHPTTATTVSKDSDFNKVPEGGCMLPCEYRLNCGHTCPIMCHSYDSAHENVQCQKPCNKILCENEHRCLKLCSKQCGPCNVRIVKEIPLCKHEVLVPCHISPDEFSCPAKCERKLPCGHFCKTLCGVRCSNPCTELVDTTLDCGHNMKIPCHFVANKAMYLNACKVKCHFELQCGHICSGSCGDCHQGRLHQICKNPCKRILVCGHECKAKCSKNCPPCIEKCENRCIHNHCALKCGDSCSNCKEPCPWSCEHQKCSKECGELCDREPCDLPCTKMLKCGHGCIGLCGEPCPNLCAVCNPEIKEIFFGTEDSEDAKFIELEDCKHVFEVEGITHWMEMANKRKGEIQMKACPRCKTVIRKSLRFGNIIKTCLADIEKVKSAIFGEVSANLKKLSLLIPRLNNLCYFYKFTELLNPLLNVLKKRKKLSSPDIIRSENIITMMEEYLKFDNFFRDCKTSFGEIDKRVKYFAKLTCQVIDDFISQEYLTASAQQLEELTWEIQRLKLIQAYLKFRQANPGLSDVKKKLCGEFKTTICNLGPFRSSDEQQCKDIFQKLGAAVLNISDVEKKSILKAMNLSQGHWYMCPNGHVYCITECGGAVVESRCSECNATIGGSHHALRGDNRLASIMDGARHSAWPQTYDLRNYGELE